MLDSVYIDDLQIHDTDRYALSAFDYGQPSPRSSLVTFARRHGGVDYSQLYAERTFNLAGEIWGATSAGLWSAVDALKSRLIIGGDLSLRFTRTGKTEQLAYVRPASEVDLPMRGGGPFLPFSVTLVAADPRIYSYTEHDESYDPSVAATGNGVNFPLTYPLTFYGTASGTLDVENAGTFPTFPTFTVNGPATSPVIENITTGETITTTASLATSSDSLWIDVAKREVRLGGSSGTLRPDLITVASTTFFDFDPGVTSLRLTGTGFVQGSSFLRAQWRDAWV